jgi:hypothetical protein
MERLQWKHDSHGAARVRLVDTGGQIGGTVEVNNQHDQ